MKTISPNKYAQLPIVLKLIIVLLGVFIFIRFTDVLLDLEYTDWRKYVMYLFYVPVYSLCAMPVLTLIGAADFKSELLFIVKKKKDEYEIHFGSLFDCLMSGLFTSNRGSFRNMMLFSVVDGLLGIMNDIEDGEISTEATIKGSSYFFSMNTAAKFGFVQKPTITVHKIVLMLNIAEILLVHSFSRGKLSWPDFSQFKTVEVTAGQLLSNKNRIVELHDFLSKKIKL